MKKADEKPSSGKNGPRKRPAKKAFKNFSEYWHFTKNLPEYQRQLLVSSMPSSEQKALKLSYDRGGWEDFFMRNACDQTLDEIKDKSGQDLIQLRVKVLSGKPQLMHKTLWQYVNNCFDGVHWEYIAYIFEGITIEEHDADYVKLVKYVPED